MKRDNVFKIFCLGFLFFFGIVPSECLAHKDTDKALHFTCSLVVSATTYNVFKKNTDMSEVAARVSAFAATLAIGAVKEWTDKDFDFGDLSADAAGALVGVSMGFRF